MRFTSLLIGALSAAALAACANNEPAPRQSARVEPRPAPTAPAARPAPPRETARKETARVAPAPRSTAAAPPAAPAPVITGPKAGEMNLAALIGTDVKDPAGQTIGEVNNVLLD